MCERVCVCVCVRACVCVCVWKTIGTMTITTDAQTLNSEYYKSRPWPTKMGRHQEANSLSQGHAMEGQICTRTLPEGVLELRVLLLQSFNGVLKTADVVDGLLENCRLLEL